MSFSAPRHRKSIISIPGNEDSVRDTPSFPGDNVSNPETDEPKFTFKPSRKSLKQSGLRNSVHFHDEDGLRREDCDTKDENDGDSPVVIRPRTSRIGFLKKRKQFPRAKVSVGREPRESEDGAAQETRTEQRLKMSSKVKDQIRAQHRLGFRELNSRLAQSEDYRPRYSKEYLHELQASTPSTPRDFNTLPTDINDEIELDASELEGALIVEASAMPSPKLRTKIFSEAEIRERKERRARLAKEIDFLSVEDEEDQNKREMKENTRLVAEDEDLGEGFDELVEDGGLSLGNHATQERRKQERQLMADLISAAEGHNSDFSSDSDAERRIAYESAQTRAGLDGLTRPKNNIAAAQLQMQPKITPLPSLTYCLARLQASLKLMESDIKTKKAHLIQLRCDREDLERSRVELQASLDKTGRKYQEAAGLNNIICHNVGLYGRSVEFLGERGLESLGMMPGRPDEKVID